MSCWPSTRSTSSASIRRCSTRSSPISATFAAPLGFKSVTPIPISARLRRQCLGNERQYALVSRARRCSPILKPSTSRRTSSGKPFRFPVQWVNRPQSRFPRLCRHGRERHASAPATRSLSPPRANPRRSRASSPPTATLKAPAPARRSPSRLPMNSTSRAAMSCADPTDRPEVADQFAAHLIWMSEEQLLPGRSYLLKSGSRTVPVAGDRAQAPARRQYARRAGGADA